MTSPITPPDSRSPWAALTGVATATVRPVGRAVAGRVTLPGSKSFTNRALILAAAAEGESNLSGLLRSDDAYWCLDALRRLGLEVEVAGDRVRIGGCGGRWPKRVAELYIGSAGTIARFLPGVLAAGDGDWRVTGSAQLARRPLAPLLDALDALGADIARDAPEGMELPIRVHGHGLSGGTVTISGAQSSQFVSGLLIAAPLAKAPVEVRIPDHIVQDDYVRITLDVMREFGVEVDVSDGFDRFRTEPQPYRGRTAAIEADASTATYFLALAAVTGGAIRIDNIGYRTRQPDIRLIDVLERMGCAVERGTGHVAVQGPERLKGGFAVDMKPMSDATLTLAAIAPFADAPIEIGGVAHIRKHESDRIAVMCDALARLGIGVEERPDGMAIQPGTPRAATLDTHDDHRVAMSLAVLGAAGAGVTLKDPGCVSKTCPVFFDLLRDLGVPVDLDSAPLP